MSYGYDSQHPRSFRSFARGMAIYGLVLTILGLISLAVFRDFLSVYQVSRPQTTVNFHMLSLEKHLAENAADELMALTDQEFQLREECVKAIAEAIAPGLTAIQSTRESEQGRLTYLVRCGSRNIGSFTMERMENTRYGMAPWTVRDQSYDFSYLLGEKQILDVPQNWQVLINGKSLQKDREAVDRIAYEELLEYEEDYTLPHMLRYEYGPLAGEIRIQLLDPAGNEMDPNAKPDLSKIMPQVPFRQEQGLQNFLRNFVRRYVLYTGANKNNARGRLGSLLNLVVPKSEFADRLRTALDGLHYGQSVRDEVTEVDIHFMSPIGEKTYLCDLTYQVNTWGKKGKVTTSTNARILVEQTRYGLKALSMTIY